MEQTTIATLSAQIGEAERERLQAIRDEPVAE